MDVRIEHFKSIRVAYMRNLGPYNTCHKTWEKFGHWMEKTGICTGGQLIIGASWDNPRTTPPEKIRYDCCIEVDDNYQPDGQVQVMEIKGGEYAVYRHKGSYGEIEGVFRKMFQEWFPNSGRESSCDACLEIYRNDHTTTPVSELITDICVPLKPLE